MPRPALKNVSTAALQAEIERRVSKLADLLKLRDDVDRQIADLQALAGQFGKTIAAEAPVAGKKRGRKAKVAKVAAKNGKRASYDVNANDFVISLLAGGKSLTTAELKAGWEQAGRGGRVDNVLTALVKSKLVKRSKVKNSQGSTYSLAASGKAAAKPVAKKAVRNFSCPTCKAMFDSGVKLGRHYKAEPTHRKK